MEALEELKAMATTIADDAAAASQQVTVALDFIMKRVDDAEVRAVIDSLAHSHAVLTDATRVLKEKVDSVMVSGGDA